MSIISVGGYILKKIELRSLTEEERVTLENPIKSQTAPSIEVERGKTICVQNLLASTFDMIATSQDPVNQY